MVTGSDFYDNILHKNKMSITLYGEHSSLRFDSMQGCVKKNK